MVITLLIGIFFVLLIFIFVLKQTLNAFAVNITIILEAHLRLFLHQCTGIDTQAQLPDI